MPDIFYSVQQVAIKLNTTASTVHYHIRLGHITPRKVGYIYALTTVDIAVLAHYLVPQRRRKT